jgi:hypothetical protein
MFTIFGSVLAFAPIVVLMYKGEEWRIKLGKPRNVNALDADYEGPMIEVDKLGEERKLDEV